MPGTLTHTPAHVLQQVLVTENLGAAPAQGASWPVTFAVEADAPDNVITVYDVGGTQNGRTNPDNERQERHGIQFRIRASVEEDGFRKANAIAIAMDEDVYQYVVTIDTQTYLVHSFMRTSGPLSEGKETPISKRSLYTVNGTVMLRQTN